MIIIAIANHKGGVGKTTTARNLGAILATEHGQRVLLVDLDPQAALTRGCDVRDARGHSMAEVLGGGSPGTLSMGDILWDVSPGLALAPGDIALSRSELGLTTRLGREGELKRALASLENEFDVCLMDTPPSLGLLTVNALVAANGLVIPTLPELLALHALAAFWETVQIVQQNLNPGLQIIGVVVTFYDGRTIHHRDALDAIRAAGYPLMRARIGRTIRLAESAIAGQAMIEYDPENPQTAAYQDLGQEVIQWQNSARE